MNTILRLRALFFCLTTALLLQGAAVAQTDPIPVLEPQGLSKLGFTLAFSYDYPTIEMVAEKLSEDYGVQDYYFEFEKRPEGYFIAMIDPASHPKVAKREMFWSSADGQWKPLTLKKGMKRVGHSSELIRDKFYHDRIPYYGYPGWYRDVINQWEGKAPLSDVLQFSLAAAWYQRATALLSDQYGVADSVETFILPNTKNALSPEQLEVYLEYMNRSLVHYETLARQAPDYETIVGPATVKLADQYMTAFMQLHYFQNEATAMKILDRPPLTFNEYLLESSRNLLRCCPKNAILLTYGDNDTYPLWYVQAKEGFRRDVVVANLSLLATGRYINHLRDRIFDAAPLSFQISPDFYFSDTSTVIYIREEGGAIPIADFFACVSSKNGEREFGFPVCQVASVYFFTDPSGKVLPSATESPKKGNKVEIQLSAKSYLIRDQLAVLDLLYSNTPDRPLCFATTCRGEYLEPFEKHLRLQGLVYRFDPKPMEVLKDLKGAIDVAQSYRFFAKEMEHTSKGEITFDGFPYLATHKNYLFFTARELNKQGKKKKAAELLNRYFEVYPNDRVLFDRSMLYLAFAYADAGKLDKALAIVRQVLDNFEAGKIDWEGYEAWSIETIKSLAKESKDQDLLKRLEKY
jgi:hypothetical protein